MVSARLFAATGLVTSFFILASCKETSETSASTAPGVDVQAVGLQELAIRESFNGRVEAVDNANILPRVSGYITKVAFKEGSDVKKGDLLFVIDQRSFRTALASAEAQLKRAQASLDLAGQQRNRAQKLIHMNAISREEAEEKNAAYDQASANVSAARSAVNKAALELDFTEVRSPIDGKVSRARLTLGNLAVADASSLTTVVSQNPVYVYFDPDEKTLLKHNLASGSHHKAVVEIGLAGDADYPYSGVLDFVDNEVNPTTGTVKARARVQNPGGNITPGMYAKVGISLGKPVATIVLPDRAVHTDQDKKFVYLVSSDNTVEKRYVIPGRLVKNDRIISSGLQPGDKVVVSGFQQILASGGVVTPHLVTPENLGMQASAASELPNRQ